MSDIQAIVMPKWGLAMEEGTLNTWLVETGASVEKGQEIAEIESTKIANVFECPVTGTLRRRIIDEGEIVAVGALLAVVAPESVSDADIDAFVAGFVVESDGEGDDPNALSERRFEHAGKTLAYKVAGVDTSGVPVVLIHGFGGDADNWLFNIGALSEGKRPVYAIDLPGHGNSSKSLAQGDLAELAEAVRALLDHASLKQAHLVGHSMGAAVCFQVLQDAPDRVASVAGIAPAGIGDALNETYIRSFIASEKRKDVKAALQMLFANADLVSATMIEGIQRYKRMEGVNEALETVAANVFPQGRQVASFRALLEKTDKPVLVVWGREDAVIPFEQSALLPHNVEIVALDGIGHMPQMEAADMVNTRIGVFFDRARG